MDTRITVERLTWAGDTFTKKDVFTFAAIDQRVLAHFFARLPNRFTRLITPRARDEQRRTTPPSAAPTKPPPD